MQTNGQDQSRMPKIKSGDYQDPSEVIRDSLRRWKEREEGRLLEREWLEREIQEGFDSPDLRPAKSFWKDLKKELHEERKYGSGRR